MAFIIKYIYIFLQLEGIFNWQRLTKDLTSVPSTNLTCTRGGSKVGIICDVTLSFGLAALNRSPDICLNNSLADRVRLSKAIESISGWPHRKHIENNKKKMGLYNSWWLQKYICMHRLTIELDIDCPHISDQIRCNGFGQLRWHCLK